MLCSLVNLPQLSARICLAETQKSFPFNLSPQIYEIETNKGMFKSFFNSKIILEMVMKML